MKGMQGLNKALNSKAGQTALAVVNQLAELPAVRNSKFNKYTAKGLAGLNMLQQIAAKQSGGGKGQRSLSLRHVGQRGRGLLLGANSPFNGVPILGDIF